MQQIETTPDSLILNAGSLPVRRGQRPGTIRGPLHVQFSDNADESALRELLHEVVRWPDIEPCPLPVGDAPLLSLRLAEQVATDDSSAFISGREFGRVLYGSLTIYLSLPLSCAHWAMVRERLASQPFWQRCRRDSSQIRWHANHNNRAATFSSPDFELGTKIFRASTHAGEA
jgi:hypothetical protein